jgi:hydroxypyruvate isomerase
MATALRYAQRCRASAVHVMAGDVPRTPTRPSATAAGACTCATCARRARTRRQGVTITIEPLNPRDMPGYLLSTQADAHAIREEVGMPNLKVQMDLYHAQIVEGDLTEKLRRWLPHVGHIQIAGVPGRHEPNVGEVNYDFLFRVLDERAVRRLDRLRVQAGGGHRAGLGWMYRLIDRQRAPAKA